MGEQGSSSIYTILILVAFFAVIYFLMIRPRQKQQKTHQEMMTGLRKGDKVITSGGIYGQIESVSEDTVMLKIESGVTLKMARGSMLSKQGDKQIAGK